MMSSTPKQDSDRPSNEQIANQFNAMRMDVQRLAAKIVDLETERDEHKLVIDALTPMEPDRKCFRLINGILIERTVKDILPALQLNMTNIKALVEKLAEGYQQREKELVEFQRKYDIRVESANGAGKNVGKEGQGSVGLLV